jgi:hypothetical protein
MPRALMSRAKCLSYGIGKAEIELIALRMNPSRADSRKDLLYIGSKVMSFEKTRIL